MVSHSPGSTDSKSKKICPELQWEVSPQECFFGSNYETYGAMTIIFQKKFQIMSISPCIFNMIWPEKRSLLGGGPSHWSLGHIFIGINGARKIGKHTDLISNPTFNFLSTSLGEWCTHIFLFSKHSVAKLCPGQSNSNLVGWAKKALIPTFTQPPTNPPSPGKVLRRQFQYSYGLTFKDRFLGSSLTDD